MTARRTLDRSMTEAQLQAAVIACAKALRWRVYHTYDSRRSERGFPDLVMLRHGKLLVVELKSAFGRTSRDQDAWLDAFKWFAESAPESVGVYQWRPIDWSSGEIERVLRDA